MSIYTAPQPVYRGYTFPLWSIILGWCLAFSSVAAIPIVAILTWCNKSNRALSASPEKSPRKRTGGADSVASSRHGSGTRKSPSQHYKSVSVSCANPNQGDGNGSGLTTTTTILTTPHEQHHHLHLHYTSAAFKGAHKTTTGEEML